MFDPSFNRKLCHYDEYVEDFDDFNEKEEKEPTFDMDFKLLNQNKEYDENKLITEKSNSSLNNDLNTDYIESLNKELFNVSDVDNGNKDEHYKIDDIENNDYDNLEFEIWKNIDNDISNINRDKQKNYHQLKNIITIDK